MATMQEIETKLATIVMNVGKFEVLIQRVADKLTEIIGEFQALEADYRGVLEQLKGLELVPQVLDMVGQIETRLAAGNERLAGVLDSITTHPIPTEPS
jgi:hypothetical protein